MPLPVRAAIVAFACLTALVAFHVREQNAIGVALEPTGPNGLPVEGGSLTWGSYDPDSLYHARRVARAVQNAGWVSSFDPFLAHPDGLDRAGGGLGTPIPWPPAYDLLLAALARGRLPSVAALLPPPPGEAEPEPPGVSEPLLPPSKLRIEQLVAAVPMWCGALTALIAALCAAGLSRTLVPVSRAPMAGVAAALVAGLTVAFTFGHVRYSHLGNGDHHAFISLLHVSMLGLVSSGLRPDRITRPVSSAARGGVAGLLAGVMITSWTASILWVALVQLALGLRLALPFHGEGGRQSARGLPIFATTFHKAALLVVMPAVIESPYTSSDPFSLIELSWLHMLWLAVGWLIFAPYALMPKFAAQRRLAATLPAAALGVLVLFGTDAGAGLLDALSWAGAENPFMAGINESQPLAGSPLKLLKFAGAGVLLAPVIWVLAVRRVGEAPQLLPWVTVLPVLLVFTLLQRRFAEGMTAPLAVLLGAFLAARIMPKVGRPELRAAAAVALMLLAIGANPGMLDSTLARGRVASRELAPFVTETDMARRQRAQAALLTALRAAETPAPAAAQGVLAEWDLGHSIEWRAERPTVASNFGLYLGEASFLAPWRFFTETSELEARRMLWDLDVGLVLIDGRTAARRTEISAALGLGERDERFWAETMGERLGSSAEASSLRHPGFLKLVGSTDPRVAPGKMRAYAVVPGARLRAEGQHLQVSATLSDGFGGSLTWRASARAAEDQLTLLEVRIPYGVSGEPAGEAIPGQPVVQGLSVFLDGEPVQVELTDWDVTEGRLVELN